MPSTTPMAALHAMGRPAACPSTNAIMTPRPPLGMDEEIDAAAGTRGQRGGRKIAEAVDKQQQQVWPTSPHRLALARDRGGRAAEGTDAQVPGEADGCCCMSHAGRAGRRAGLRAHQDV